MTTGKATWIERGYWLVQLSDDLELQLPVGHEAIARLIAAAPELLEALRSLESAVISLDSCLDARDRTSVWAEWVFPAIDKARAVIAKATVGDAIERR